MNKFSTCRNAYRVDAERFTAPDITEDRLGATLEPPRYHIAMRDNQGTLYIYRVFQNKVHNLKST